MGRRKHYYTDADFFKAAPLPEPDPQPLPPNRTICDGDKLHCPYLTRIEKRGYCPFPRCFNEEG